MPRMRICGTSDANALNWQVFRQAHKNAGSWGRVHKRYFKVKEHYEKSGQRKESHYLAFSKVVKDFPVEVTNLLDSITAKVVDPELEDAVPPVSASAIPTPKKQKPEDTDPVSDVEIARWVFEHLSDKDLTIDDAPTRGAWFLLEDCQNSDAIRRDFRLAWMRTTLKRDEAGVDQREVREMERMDTQLLEFEKQGGVVN